MKKLIIVLVTVAALGFVGSQALAWWGPGGGWGAWGPGCGYYANTNPTVQQQFLNDTAKLRSDLAAKRAEYVALMAQPNPDPRRTAELSREIFQLQEQLRLKAQEHGLQSWGGGAHGYHGGHHMGPYAGGYCWR
ncbi:MAG: periplasmic heavy metal sensor [Deltaproteobacteria bacterium]|nr:periplasmic heavy metal sensor [Deltaproteobacteria bacterium]MBW2069943.1 periplasmic heavy metal sensor [Deltaproteobacteria bacterium]